MQVVIPETPVPLWRLFLRMGGWVVLIAGVILLVVTLISWSSLRMAQRFETEGRPATAIVTEKYQREGRDSDGNRTVTYYLTLDYTTARGERISLNRTVNSGEYRRASEGERFDLLYLASEPRKTELTPGHYRKGAQVGQIVGLVVGLIWLGALWLVGGWAVAAVRARRYGQREEAQVVELRRTSIRVNNRPRYRVIWRDAAGREGRSLLRKWRDIEGLQVGDTVPIYHGVKRSWWAGDVGERPEPR